MGEHLATARPRILGSQRVRRRSSSSVLTVRDDFLMMPSRRYELALHQHTPVGPVERLARCSQYRQVTPRMRSPPAASIPCRRLAISEHEAHVRVAPTIRRRDGESAQPNRQCCERKRMRTNRGSQVAGFPGIRKG